MATKKYVELWCEVSFEGFIPPLIYNIVLIVICSVYGFKTRKLPDNFNESWFVFLIACMTFFMWLLFLPGYFVATSAYQRSLLLALCTLINVIINIGCLFFPKLYALFFVAEQQQLATRAVGGQRLHTFATAATAVIRLSKE